MSFVKELKRRNVFRMAAVYAIAAWVIMQVAEVLNDLARLPDWVGPTILALLAVGFPIALTLAWFYELTPVGVSLEKDVDREESITHITGRRLDFIVISLLAAAVVLFSYDKWWTRGPDEQSIAVLPFINMSGDDTQEYFSDGISEELLNLLARIPELRVISRTSAFAYKGKAMKVADIARELNVANILEGSVRKDGNQVRVTVQLIEAHSDTHLWSETYERTLKDIFSVQEEIANIVVDKLKVTLLDNSPTIEKTDPEAYALYLQANHLTGLMNPDSLQMAIDLYKKVLATDNNYVPAWLGLSNAYDNMGAMRALPNDEARALSRDAIKRVLEISPDSALAYGHLAWDNFIYRGDLNMAARNYERAMALAPTNTGLIGDISIFLSALGRMDQAILLGEYQISRDPANPFAYNNLGLRYRYAGRNEDAQKAFLTALTLSPFAAGVEYELGATFLLDDDYVAAASAFEREPMTMFGQIGMAMTYYALGENAASDQVLNDLIEKSGDDVTYYIAQILAYKGESDDAFEWLNKAKSTNDSALVDVINEPLFSNLHTDPRWLPYLEGIGKSADLLATIDFEVGLPK